MGNLFENLQKNLHNTVNSTFGRMIQWGELSAKCLYREPTEKFKLGEFPYSPNLFQVEYRKGDLSGLYELVMTGSSTEIVTIYSIGKTPEDGIQYGVMSGRAEWDGETLRIFIEKL